MLTAGVTLNLGTPRAEVSHRRDSCGERVVLFVEGEGGHAWASLEVDDAEKLRDALDAAIVRARNSEEARGPEGR